MTFEVNTIGHMSATQGYPAFIPLLALWKSGNFPGVANLPAQPVTANTVAHVASNAPNTGNWYFSTGTSWTNESPSTPVWYVTTLNISDGTNTYICHADAWQREPVDTRTAEHLQDSGQRR